MIISRVGVFKRWSNFVTNFVTRRLVECLRLFFFSYFLFSSYCFLSTFVRVDLMLFRTFSSKTFLNYCVYAMFSVIFWDSTLCLGPFCVT